MLDQIIGLSVFVTEMLDHSAVDKCPKEHLFTKKLRLVYYLVLDAERAAGENVLASNDRLLKGKIVLPHPEIGTNLCFVQCQEICVKLDSRYELVPNRMLEGILRDKCFVEGGEFSLLLQQMERKVLQRVSQLKENGHQVLESSLAP